MLKITTFFKKIMANFTSRIQKIISVITGRYDIIVSENVLLRQRLADALANDAADAETIAAAQAELMESKASAEAALAESARLQALVDADNAEDAALDELLKSFEESEEQVSE